MRLRCLVRVITEVAAAVLESVLLLDLRFVTINCDTLDTLLHYLWASVPLSVKKRKWYK